jgi:hypothetical protein
MMAECIQLPNKKVTKLRELELAQMHFAEEAKKGLEKLVAAIDAKSMILDAGKDA